MERRRVVGDGWVLGGSKRVVVRAPTETAARVCTEYGINKEAG